jgi:hypothetical protein
MAKPISRAVMSVMVSAFPDTYERGNRKDPPKLSTIILF